MRTMATELSVMFASAFLDGEDLASLFSSPTVDLFALVSGLGWLAIRAYECDYGDDWRRACRFLPAGTFIDPGEWEAHSMGVESLFIPQPRSGAVTL